MSIELAIQTISKTKRKFYAVVMKRMIVKSMGDGTMAGMLWEESISNRMEAYVANL